MQVLEEGRAALAAAASPVEAAVLQEALTDLKSSQEEEEEGVDALLGDEVRQADRQLGVIERLGGGLC